MKRRLLLLPVLLALMSVGWATNYTTSCIVPAGRQQCNLIFPTAGFGPAQAPLVQGDTLTITATSGAALVNLNYVFTGTVSSVSITAAPCGLLGTCDSAASTYTSTSNGNAGFQLTQAYPVIKITVGTLTSGATVKIGFSTLAHAGGSGGGYYANDIAPHNMTADSAPSPYVVSADAEYQPAYQAFDGDVGHDNTNVWESNSGLPTWLQIDLGSGHATVVLGYCLAVPSDAASLQRSPASWTFKGSNDGSTFTTLDTEVSQTFPVAGFCYQFPASGSTAYRYFRWNITANGGDATYTFIGEVSLFTKSA